MGLIANYSCLSDVNLKELKAMGSEEEEILDSVEEWSDEEDLFDAVCAQRRLKKLHIKWGAYPDISKLENL